MDRLGGPSPMPPYVVVAAPGVRFQVAKLSETTHGFYAPVAECPTFQEAERVACALEMLDRGRLA